MSEIWKCQPVVSLVVFLVGTAILSALYCDLIGISSFRNVSSVACSPFRAKRCFIWIGTSIMVESLRLSLRLKSFSPSMERPRPMRPTEEEGKHSPFFYCCCIIQLECIVCHIETGMLIWSPNSWWQMGN